MLSQKKLIVCIAVLVFMSITLFADAGLLDRGLELTYPDLPGVPTLNRTTTLPGLLAYVFTFFVVIGGLIAFGSIVFAGFQFMISGANPAMRSQAMNRIRNVIFGLVLLLSSYLMFNTINPELVLLYTRGVSPDIPPPPKFEATSGIFDSVDYDTLRYGGVIVFNENYRPPGGKPGGETCDSNEGNNVKWFAATGRCEESATILHDVGNPDGTGETFEDVSYLSEDVEEDGGANGNAKISSIKVLGNCKVQLFYDSADNNTADTNPGNDSAVAGIALNPGITYLTGPEGDDVMKLVFFDAPAPAGKKSDDCLGHSLKVFENINYNQGSGPTRNGSLTLITNENDLNDRDFIASTPTKKVAKNVKSMRFAFEGTDSRIADTDTPLVTLPNKALVVNVCNKKGFGGSCITTSTSTPNIASATNGWGPGPDMQFATTMQSIKFAAQEYRQAGVILYENPDFENGRFEIFIASDANLNPSFAQNDRTSAIVIIGKYRVTLYGDEEFNPSEGWVMFDNTNPDSPWVTTWVQIGSPDGTFNAGIDEALERDGSSTMAVNLENFCAQYKKDDAGERTIEAGCDKSFNDMVSSIKIELLEEDYVKIFENPATPGTPLQPCNETFFDTSVIAAATAAGIIKSGYCIL